MGQGVAELGEHSHGEAGAVGTGVAGAAVDIGRSQIGVGVGDELLPHGVGGRSTLIVGIVDRLGILGGDVAGGLAEGYLVPAVLIVVEAVDGEGGGGVVIGSTAKPNGLGELHTVVLA